MLFNSLQFAVFFPAVVVTFYLLPHHLRWIWLLLSSCVFYSYYIPAYLLILLLTIVVDYSAGIWIERSLGRKRQIILWLSIGTTCAILFFFKYFNFMLSNFFQVCSLAGFDCDGASDAYSGYPLPIGLSFHTFQSLSYVIEVYRGNQKAERHFGIYSLYVLFFPQLVAGPIERPQNLLHQFHEVKTFKIARASSGLRLIGWGLFQKTVVADRLGVLVDYVYDTKGSTPVAYLIATVFFAFQIYADFQGYSNVARGAARILGFELMKNFNSPYAARSVTEFWRRWHISLSTWFRDYLYVPLGGSHCGRARTAFNLMITFTVSGLWHGANWTYVIWGLLNGLWVIIERWSKWKHISSRCLTFILICLTWIFFRASSLEKSLEVLSSLPAALMDFAGLFWGRYSWTDMFKQVGMSYGNFWLCWLAIVTLIFIDSFEGDSDLGDVAARFGPRTRWASYILLTVVLVISWVYFPVSAKPFIYFQF